MTEPWNLTAAQNNAAALYPAWVGSNYTLYHSRLCLCNWFPLSVLVKFAVAHGFGLTLDYWPGRAPTAPDAKRSWNTAVVNAHASHSGTFASVDDYKHKVESTVTARMIGTLNTIAVAANDLRIGDMLLRNYGDRYWHAELIVTIEGDNVTTEAGSTPAKKPVANVNSYTRSNLANGDPLYQNAARRWDFNKIIILK